MQSSRRSPLSVKIPGSMGEKPRKLNLFEQGTTTYVFVCLGSSHGSSATPIMCLVFPVEVQT